MSVKFRAAGVTARPRRLKTGMLRRAVSSVVEDQSFHIAVEPAATALRTAKNVLEWADTNKEDFLSFEELLCSTIRPCLRDQRVSKASKECMWRNFHQIRTLESFRLSWCKFLTSQVKVASLPAFYQAVTDNFFKEMILIQAAEEPDLQPVQPITYEDANVIRYAAGYVCRNVHEKVKKSRQPNKNELLQSVTDLVDANRGKEPSSTPTTAWINEVDRGGLWHVKEGTFMLFQAMEEKVREHFRIGKVSTTGEGYRATVVKKIINNEDVAFYWCMLTTDLSGDDADLLLQMLVELWVTIRGFSFVSSWIELYKQEKEENLQRSKSLRKKIT